MAEKRVQPFPAGVRAEVRRILDREARRIIEEQLSEQRAEPAQKNLPKTPTHP